MFSHLFFKEELFTLVHTAAELGQKKTTDQSYERAMLAASPKAAQGLVQIINALVAQPDQFKPFINSDSTLPKQVEKFSADKFYQALKNTQTELVAAADRNLKQVPSNKGDEQSLIAKGEDKAEQDKPLPSEKKSPTDTQTPTTEKAGPGTSAATTTSTGSTPETGSQPSSENPANVYGEELDDIVGGDNAISIHVIKCDDVTGWGPSGALDDEIAWHCVSRQKFTDLVEPIVAEFTSSEYEDVSSGDRYSALDDGRNPSTEEETKVDLYKDDKLCPRLWRPMIEKGRRVLAEDNESAFRLDKFEHCRITVTLFEVGETLEGIIEEILRLVLHLTGLGAGVGSALTPAGLIQNALGSGPQSSLIQASLKELEDFIAKLLNNKSDRIGKDHFIVKKTDIETAFSSGTPVATRYGFSYVLGPEITLTGKNSDYKIQLRYEDHS